MLNEVVNNGDRLHDDQPVPDRRSGTGAYVANSAQSWEQPVGLGTATLLKFDRTRFDFSPGCWDGLFETAFKVRTARSDRLLIAKFQKNSLA